MSGFAWEPMAMAVLVGGMGVWALVAAFGHSDKDLRPPRPSPWLQSKPGDHVHDVLYRASPRGYSLATRVGLVIGAIVLGITAAYCMHLAFRG